MSNKIRLHGFNNLTKTLSFNIYDICYTNTEEKRENYIKYINEKYNAKNLTTVLEEVTETIGATVLNISKQDYEPTGASVNILICEDYIEGHEIDLKNNIVGHLDKSHLTVHTYPETHPNKDISTFRVDIDISTCGTISPLNALNYLINKFNPDIITIDYKVRGFTRDEHGKKYFMDHNIKSITDFIDSKILLNYDKEDVNVDKINIFHTKMIKNNFKLENYMIDDNIHNKYEIQKNIYNEMKEISKGNSIF